MRATILAGLLILCGMAANASTFNIHYVPTSGQTCLTIACFPFVGSPFDAQFMLTSADLSADGTYDIASSLTQFTAYTPGPGITLSLTADAIVSGGAVTGVTISWSHEVNIEPIPGDQVLDTDGFTALGDGTFSSSSTAFSSLGPSHSSTSQAGTYTISAVPTPEPASVALIGVGLLALGPFRRRPL